VDLHDDAALLEPLGITEEELPPVYNPRRCV
jgi:hypothetical protein